MLEIMKRFLKAYKTAHTNDAIKIKKVASLKDAFLLIYTTIRIK